GGASLRLAFFFSSRRRHTRSKRDWSSDVCSSDLCARSRWRRRPEMRLVALTLALLAAGTGEPSERVVPVVARRFSYSPDVIELRSEERRVGKAWRCTGALCEFRERARCAYGEYG